MQALIELNNDTEYIVVTCGGIESKVKVVGTPDEPYFYGKDVCMVLGYKDIKKALQNNVKPKHKTTAIELSELVGKFGSPTFMGRVNLRNLTHNAGRAIYINESGLYNLILRSEAPFASEFQDQVTEKILPDIRKYGQFNLNRDYLALQGKYEEQTLALEASSKEVEKLRRDVACFKNYIKEIDLKPKNEWIYIATTDQYARNSRFKVGSTKHLSKRLCSYQTGRSIYDRFFFCWVERVYDSKEIDAIIKHHLSCFLEKATKEVYILPYYYLEKYVSMIVDNENDVVEDINNFKRVTWPTLLNQLDNQPIPPSIDTEDLNTTTIIQTNSQLLDLTNLSSIEQEQIIRERLDLFQEQGEVNRKTLLEPYRNKRDVWSAFKHLFGWTKSTVPIQGVVVKY